MGTNVVIKYQDTKKNSLEWCVYLTYYRACVVILFWYLGLKIVCCSTTKCAAHECAYRWGGIFHVHWCTASI